MQSRLAFIVKYWLAWIAFFEIARLLFLLKNSEESAKAGFNNMAGSLWHGLRMDASMASYLALPVVLFCILSVFILFFQRPVIYQVYTSIVLSVCILLLFIDLNLFKAWGYRIDAGFLKYLSNPREVYASVSHLPLLAILLALMFCLAIFIYFFNRRIRVWTDMFRPVFSKWWSLLCLLIVAGSLIIPIRGGLQLAPLNQSSVYFSSNNFANQAAINASWNFMHSLAHRSDETNNFIYLDNKKAELIVDSMYMHRHADSALRAVSKPNIVLIVGESFTSKAIGLLKDGIEVTPGINKLKDQGFYFSQIYASGDRTDKGIVAILSGYPAQPTTSIVKTPSKAAKLPMLPEYFAGNGYETAFYYGGELEFANMKAYLMNGGFQKFISINDFASRDQNSKWGAHDDVVMNRFLSGIQQAKPPFFYTWLTLSSHEPFEIPVEKKFKGSDDESAYLSSLHYTDSVIETLVSKLRQLPSWSTTIVVIVADHGHKLPRTSHRLDDFKIPVLMIGPALGKIYTDGRIGSQTDLAATILAITGLRNGDFKWSRNLMDSTRREWGYFSFNNGFGYAENTGSFIFDNIGKQIIESRGKIDGTMINRGKAMLQLSFGDYLSK